MKKVLLLALISSLLVGCSSSDKNEQTNAGSDTELNIMHFATKEAAKTDPKAAAIQKQLDKFMEENKDIELNITEMSHDDYQMKIQQLAAADSMPDVFMLKGAWVDTFRENNLIADVSSYIDEYEYKDMYYDGIFKIATRDDEIFGVPYEGNTSTTYVYYNKEMWKSIGFESFPDNWDDVFVAIEKFKEKGITPFGLGNKDKWPYESCVLSTLGNRFTGPEWTQSIIAKDGKAKFTDPEFVAALQLTSDLAKAGAFNEDMNSVDNNMTQSLFINNKVSAIIEGYWAKATILANGSEEFIKNVGIAPLPQPKNAKGSINSASGGAGWFFAINGQLEGEKKDKAAELILNLCGKEYAEYITGTGGEIGPCKVDVDTSKFDSLTQDYLALTNTYEIVPVYDVWMTPEVIEVMNTSLQGILGGMLTPEDAAKAMQQALEE